MKLEEEVNEAKIGIPLSIVVQQKEKKSGQLKKRGNMSRDRESRGAPSGPRKVLEWVDQSTDPGRDSDHGAASQRQTDECKPETLAMRVWQVPSKARLATCTPSLTR